MTSKTRPTPPAHDVYRNLHTETWSLVDRTVGRVMQHPTEVAIKDATFVVQPAGNAKVRRTKKKHVHAFVRGRQVDVVDFTGRPTFEDVRRSGVRLTYNPYKHTAFVEADTEQPVKAADLVALLSDGTAWAINPR